MSVKYQVYTRYLNDKTNKIITNKTLVEWYENDYQDNPKYDDYDKTLIAEDIERSDNAESMDKVVAVQETFIVSPEEPTPEEVSSYYDKMIKEMDLLNPKYDMLFLYNGIGRKEMEDGSGSNNGGSSSNGNTKGSEEGGEDSFTPSNPEIYYDKMLRIKLDPWFFHSEHASLQSAMNIGNKLANIFGADGIKIGKIVPIDQYIDIV